MKVQLQKVVGAATDKDVSNGPARRQCALRSYYMYQKGPLQHTSLSLSIQTLTGLKKAQFTFRGQTINKQFFKNLIEVNIKYVHRMSMLYIV